MNNSFLIEVLLKLGMADFLNIISLDKANIIIRKSAHFFEYLILGALIFKTLKSYCLKNLSLITLCSGVLYAASDEIHQYFVSGRTAALKDVLIDSLGLAAGIMVIKIIERFKGNHGRTIVL
ncbi:VanZ like family protein [Oxobacter pfennigii]|uniref:VanZ like family protein n=2 Tax=Oxobacter pfennigii TaxID=36849 RepID=A0A0P8YT27_9CLOT|nr:VanZ like family protein [Oxobacter pfennigii]